MQSIPPTDGAPARTRWRPRQLRPSRPGRGRSILYERAAIRQADRPSPPSSTKGTTTTLDGGIPKQEPPPTGHRCSPPAAPGRTAGKQGSATEGTREQRATQRLQSPPPPRRRRRQAMEASPGGGQPGGTTGSRDRRPRAGRRQVRVLLTGRVPVRVSVHADSMTADVEPQRVAGQPNAHHPRRRQQNGQCCASQVAPHQPSLLLKHSFSVPYEGSKPMPKYAYSS